MNSFAADSRRSVARRAGTWIAAVLTGLTVAATPAASAAADPAGSLTVSGLEAAPGVVRFLLTARDLPLNTTLDPSTVTVAVADHTLPAEADRVSSSVSELPPRALMVIIDVSGSVAGERLAAAREAARQLAVTLPDDVRLGLIAVADQPRVLLVPTADRAAFTAALGELAARGATALYDGVRLAVATFDEIGFGPESDRRLLVLSDGVDTRSTLTLEELSTELERTAVPADVVAFRATGAGRRNLQTIAQASGGNLLTASDNTALAEQFRAAATTFSVILAVEAKVPNALAERAAELTVTMEIAGRPVGTSVPVTFGEPVHDPTVTSPAPPRPLPSWALWMIAGVFFVSLLVLVLAPTWPRSTKEQRIQQISQFGPARSIPPPRPVETASGLTRTALAVSESFVRSRNLESRIILRLDQAGMRLRPHEWVLIQGCAVVAGGALGLALFSWLGLLIGVLFGGLGPRLYRSMRADRRTQQFAEQLPDVLQLVIGSLRSGFSLEQSLDTVVREAAEPVAAEFARALAEHRLGADISQALERVTERTRSEDLRWVVMAVRIQREVGGNLAEVLQTAVETMRERARLRRHVRSLSAEGRLSAWVLIALPIALGAFMFTFRRAYMQPLFTEPLGVAMLVIGLLMLGVGVIWITRVVKVEA
ncbi:MAG TPA: type II secretion system F family protein [Micromonosporaceae bacterium]